MRCAWRPTARCCPPYSTTTAASSATAAADAWPHPANAGRCSPETVAAHSPAAPAPPPNPKSTTPPTRPPAPTPTPTPSPPPPPTRTAAQSEIHHTTDWATGGHTNLDSMAIACGYHNTEAPRQNWRTVMIDGIPHWQPPPWHPIRQPLRNHLHHPELSLGPPPE